MLAMVFQSKIINGVPLLQSMVQHLKLISWSDGVLRLGRPRSLPPIEPGDRCGAYCWFFTSKHINSLCSFAGSSESKLVS